MLSGERVWQLLKDRAWMAGSADDLDSITQGMVAQAVEHAAVQRAHAHVAEPRWAVAARTDDGSTRAVEAGASSPVAFRWFRHAGGVNPGLPATVSGRCLSSADREEIAL